MVDVWNELGKAIGALFKPLFKLGDLIWKGFGDAAGDLVKGFMGAAGDLGEAVEPTITGLMPSVFDEAAAALGEDSPDPKTKEAIDKFVKQLLAMIEKKAETKGTSLPTGVELAATQAKLVAGIVAMYASTHAISMALDASHLLKDWGFKTAMMDVMYQFNMAAVIGPMISAPIWASSVVPLRYRANAKYPYQVPGTGVLPYFVAKGIITDDEYKENMGYGAYDATWSDRMLENTWRYPSFSELRTMVHRTDMTWENAKSALEKSLIHKDYVANYEELLPEYPGLGDLITMMVREVIPPEKFREMAGLMGLSAEWADNYYENHWILLPLGEVKKARHRGDITKGELDKFLVLHDYKPTPRPDIKLSDAAIAAGLIYDRPGRIESRWLYRWGEINLLELQGLLEDAGLDPNWSERVAKAVGMNQFLVDINRQVANSKASFVKGYIVEATLRADIAALGFRSEIVEYHIVDALADRARGVKDDQLRTLRSQYARGAMSIAAVMGAVTPIIVDSDTRDAWVAALPSAKQVMIMEETHGTEINRLVVNAKYDYVKGYIEKPAMVSRFTLLGLPTEVIEYHVMDADEDRARTHKDKQLTHIEEGYIDDVISWREVETMAELILIDEEAYKLFLDGVWLNKHKAVRVAAGE